METIVLLPKGKRFRMETRYQIVLATFLATFTAYVERVGFSIAITEMAKGVLNESVKGSVLSLFYWGYGLSMIPGGWAAQRYGGRVTLLLCFLAWSTVSIFTPTDANNTLAIKSARFLVGIAQGFLIPAVHTSLSQWVPPHERARSVSLSTSGMYLGSAAAMLVLPSVGKAFGEPFLPKFVGLIGLAWMVMWFFVGKEVPHRENIIPQTNIQQTNNSKSRPPPTPWKRMMVSSCIWAIVVNNFCFHFAFYVIMNWLPTYFNSVLKVELASLGVVKTLPYLAMFVMSNVGGWAGDWLINNKNYPTARARKTVNTIGFIASAISLMMMPAAKGVFTGVLASTLTLGSLGFCRGGFSVNHMDIAPKYAGVVMAISNTAGTISGAIAVPVAGIILDFEGGANVINGWYHSHALCAAVCIVAMVVFNSFARGERVFD